MELNITFKFNDKLRDIADNPSDMEKHISKIGEELNKSVEIHSKIKLLSEMGSYQRILNHLSESEETLTSALALVEKFKLNNKYWVPVRIKLACTYQWQKKFNEAEAMLNNVIERGEKILEFKPYLHFAYQHLGKVHFDQMNYNLALNCFETALKFREELGDSELISSTHHAIQQTQKQIIFFNQFEIAEIESPNEKSEICSSILHLLPDWFGIEDAIVDYSERVKANIMITVKAENQIWGFISIKEHFPESSCEIYVM